MQAHPLSSPAARITLSTPSPQPRRLSANPLPPTLLLPSRTAPKAASHLDRLFQGPAQHLLVPDPATAIAGSAGLAHDAGNLLGALRLYCDLLSAPGVLAPEHRHYATDLSLIASRSSALIRRLLQSAAAAAVVAAATQPDALQPDSRQPDAGLPEDAAPQSTDPATALRELAPVLERIAAGVASVIVTAPASFAPGSLPAQPPSAEVLERIAVNLVRNAAEAIRSSRAGHAAACALPGQIRVALEAANQTMRLTVEDDGPGMPPEIAAAFLRPTPLPAGATRGLGHRIVHELAAGSGAQLSIRVRPGRGTIFCLRWPVSAHADEPGLQPGLQPNLPSGRVLEPLHRTPNAIPSTFHGAVS